MPSSPTRKLRWPDRALLDLACLAEIVRQSWFGRGRGAQAAESEATQPLAQVWRQSGWHATRLQFLTQNWPQTYRQKVQLRLGRASLTIFRKYASLFELNSPAGTGAHLEALPPKIRMLLVRNGAIGDVLMLTPVVKALHDSRQGRVQIEVLTHCPEVFRNNPYVHRVHSGRAFGRAVHDYDLVLNFNDIYEHSPRVHPVDVYAHAALGSANFDKQLALYPSASDKASVEQQVREIGAPFLVVHKPNHDWPNRNLPEDFWSELLSQLVKKTGWTLVQIGSGRDFAASGHPKLLDMRGRHNLQQLAELIRHSRGFVGVDAGPSHVAACTGVPICTFYTCAHHEVRKPLRSTGVFVPIAANLDCYGCMQRQSQPRPGFSCERGDSACVRSFAVDASVHKILAGLGWSQNPNGSGAVKPSVMRQRTRDGSNSP